MFFLLLALFLLSAGLVCYSYMIFPLWLAMKAKGRRLDTVQFPRDYPGLPGISFVMAAFNEERVIREKLEALLAFDYPSDRLEILVGSDASTDATSDILKQFAAQDARIRVFHFTERRGKPSVVNDLVRAARFPILILTDANVMPEPATAYRLVRHFRDERVGLVGANILNVGMRYDGISFQEKAYIERENLIKYHEGVVWGTMMGPFGGCFALRRSLYKDVPASNLVDDFYIAMQVMEQGYRAINELEAICYEDVSNDIYQEYRRKARISAGNFQNLSCFRRWLLRPATPLGCCFLSHKVLRWFTPLFILVSVITLSGMSFYDGRFLGVLLFELLLLLSPLWEWVLRKAGLHLRAVRFVAYFVFMNIALAQGYFRYLRGVRSGIWSPTRRNR
jgi:cellulose synthase/poly-beta-1,6-N-acetylglucosamine synthase-like glycosyltransferase